MPKLNLVYTNQINFLTVEGTADMLKAISYYQGSMGHLADPARNFIDRGIREFIESLDAKERRRFDEILENVRIASRGNSQA